MSTEKLSVDLPDDIARLVREQVRAGVYASESELITSALRAWHARRREHESRLAAIRASIAEAAADRERLSGDDVRRHFDERLAEAERKRAG
jgi:putative addiction module CopG family antidote